MPSDYLKEILSSGRAIVTDTKTPKLKKDEKPKPSSLTQHPESDPHKIFVKRMISEKPSKKELVEELHKFIKASEDQL